MHVINSRTSDLGGEENDMGGSSLFTRARFLFLQMVFAVALGALVGLVTVVFYDAATWIDFYHRLGSRTFSERASADIWGACSEGMGGRSACVGVTFAICMSAGASLSAFIVGLVSHSLVCLSVGVLVLLRAGLGPLALCT